MIKKIAYIYYALLAVIGPTMVLGAEISGDVSPIRGATDLGWAAAPLSCFEIDPGVEVRRFDDALEIEVINLGFGNVIVERAYGVDIFLAKKQDFTSEATSSEDLVFQEFYLSSGMSYSEFADCFSSIVGVLGGDIKWFFYSHRRVEIDASS